MCLDNNPKDDRNTFSIFNRPLIHFHQPQRHGGSSSLPRLTIAVSSAEKVKLLQ